MVLVAKGYTAVPAYRTGHSQPFVDWHPIEGAARERFTKPTKHKAPITRPAPRQPARDQAPQRTPRTERAPTSETSNAIGPKTASRSPPHTGLVQPKGAASGLAPLI